MNLADYDNLRKMLEDTRDQAALYGRKERSGTTPTRSEVAVPRSWLEVVQKVLNASGLALADVEGRGPRCLTVRELCHLLGSILGGLARDEDSLVTVRQAVRLLADSDAFWKGMVAVARNKERVLREVLEQPADPS